MSRRDRRAAAAKVRKLDLPEHANISGTADCCGNCKFAANRELVKKNTILLIAKAAERGDRNIPAQLPDDSTVCLYDPGGREMKNWGYCFKHQPKEIKDEPTRKVR